MNMPENFYEVSDSIPCPKCGKPDWCLLRRDGKTCVCNRVESGITWGQGWLHYLPPGEVKPIVAPRKQKVYLNTQQVRDYLNKLDMARPMLERQADLLGIRFDDLQTMLARYDADKAVVVFPMFNASGDPIGCRLRRSDGRKWSLKGGREGVFMSSNFTPKVTVFVVEGPTDAAALVRAGFTNVIGRPNCTGGTSIIATLLDRYKSTPVIILADPDDPGINGATRLAAHLPNPAVVLVGPTDVREFVTSDRWTMDAREAILEGLIDNESSIWRAVFHNQPGKFYPFLRHFKVAA